MGTVKETKGQMRGAEIPSMESEEAQRGLMAGSGTSPNPSSLVGGCRVLTHEHKAGSIRTSLLARALGTAQPPL